MSFKPHEYQRESLNNIVKGFRTKNRLLYQLDTGGGKTVVFSFLSKYWAENTGQQVLILCHRTELIDQTLETLSKMGVTCEKIVSEKKNIRQDVEVFIAMVDTVNNRLESGKIDLFNVGLVIADECHVLVFEKVFEKFKNAKILGVTATPVILKKIKYYYCEYCHKEHETQIDCCGEETREYRKPFAMSELYEDIVIGSSIKHLIGMGQLVPELIFQKKVINEEDLKTDSDGEYTSESQTTAFSNEDAVINVVSAWKELCSGKRTIVFNSSSKVNKLVYDALKKAGANVRLFDSVNRAESGSRKALVKWFRETEDAVLCNVNIFTAGFDCKEVQAVVLNRATLSLSLYLQMVGRGGRASQQIYKDHFVLVDCGGNVEKYNEWSSERDWKKIFFEGIGKKKASKVDAYDVQSCESCGAIFPKALLQCEVCNTEVEIKVREEKEEFKEKEFKSVKFQAIKPIPKPSGEKIYNYVISRNQDINFAHKILINQIVDLFRYYGVGLEQYERNNIKKKVRDLIKEPYFYLMARQNIQNGGRRTLANLIDRTEKKLQIYYYGKN